MASLHSLIETDTSADWRAPYSGLKDSEAEAIIVEAAESSYRGSRFDTIEASVSGPVLKVYLHDSDACSDGASIQSIESVVDLSVYAERTASTRSVDYRNEPLTFVTFTEWHDLNRKLLVIKSTILTRARAEVGWGTKAALLASERFLQEHPLETLSSYEIVGYCPSGSSVALERDFITFQITDQQKLLDAMSRIGRRSR